MSYDKQIFGDKTLGSLLEEIHSNANEKRTQVQVLIGELKDLIESIGDATLVVPLIKEYLEIGVKNDEHLIKLATIVQRIESAAARGEAGDEDWSTAMLMGILEETEERLPFQDKKKEEESDQSDEDVDGEV